MNKNNKTMKDRRVWSVLFQGDMREGWKKTVTVEGENIEAAVKKACTLAKNSEAKALISCVQIAVIDR